MHRIALRSLFYDRGKLVAALTGVAFATLLMLLQVGIYFGFAAGSSSVVHAAGGDVWVMSRGTRHVDQGTLLPAGTDALLRSQPCVTRVRPLVVAWAPYEDPRGATDSVQLVGVEPEGDRLVPWSTREGLPADLAAPDRMTLDVHDADVVEATSSELLGASLEVAGRALHVAVVTRGIRDIGLNPMVFTSVRTARERIGAGSGQASYWIADVAHEGCIPSVIAALERDPDLDAMTTGELAESTEAELLEGSGVGVALSFVALLGCLVAIVVVAQTLYANLQHHRRELAMLKALGAKRWQLIGFVAWQAAFLAVVGSAVGTVLTLVLRGQLSGLAVNVVLPGEALVAAIAAMLALCALASLTSVRAVLRLEAIEVLA